MPPLALSRMTEAAEADKPPDSKNPANSAVGGCKVKQRRTQPWYITGVYVPPPLELSRMAEATEADVLSDSRTSKNIFHNANEAAVMRSWSQWTPRGVPIEKAATNNPTFRVPLNAKRLS